MTTQKENPTMHGEAILNSYYRNTNPSPYRQASSCHPAGFQDAMAQAGLLTRDPIVADGKLRRFRVAGDKIGSRNGWYILYGDGLPAGAFGCWKRGLAGTWCAKFDQAMTAAERAQFRQRINEARKMRQNEEVRRHREAQRKALVIWQDALLAPDNHPYLVIKRVGNHGLRLHKGALVIPLRDSDGTLHSLQFIDSEGSKRFLSGGRKKGCYFLIASPVGSLCIAEGYATAATIHESTGLSVAVAFDAGNLLPVAQVLRAKFPHIEIMICADNDAATPGNPGLTKAREAAVAIGALLAVPSCAGDFNDLYRRTAQ